MTGKCITKCLFCAIVIYMQSCKKDADILITKIITEEVSSYYDGVVKVGGNVSSQGNPTVDIRGVCYATHSTPTTSDICANDSNKTLGKYTCSITNLMGKTTYYVRAYAKNKIGVIYGEEKTFTTPEIPKISDVTITEIKLASAVGSASIRYDGSMAISEQGICWGTNTEPVISSAKKATTDITEQSFSLKLLGLSNNTKYYARAYICSDIGTLYGNVTSFTTIGIPIIITNDVQNVTKTSAICGGNIYSDGGQHIKEMGICYNLSPSPTISNQKIASSSETSSFTCNLSNLITAKIYYFKAYVITDEGVYYGSEKNFYTNIAPSIETHEVSDVSFTSVVANGCVLDDGGCYVIERGFCWSKTQNPTISDNIISCGVGIGTFNTSIENLLEGTKYYIRAYAKNMDDVFYGNQIEFKTNISEKCKASDYSQVTIGMQIWMAENYRCSNYDTESEAYKAGIYTVPMSKIVEYADTPYYTDASDIRQWDSDSKTIYSKNLLETQIAKLGYRYNWSASVGITDAKEQTSVFSGNRQGICPNGWHVPSMEEWQILYDYIYKDKNLSSNTVGKYLKTTSGWYDGSNPQTYPQGLDSYGFAALPAGDQRSTYSNCASVGGEVFFWTANPFDSVESYAKFIALHYNNDKLTIPGAFSKSSYFSVRCIKN